MPTFRIGLGFCLAVAVLLFVATRVDAGSGQPRELGRVDWGRSYDEAVARSAASGKPIFLLFQEVPGCATCVNFGEQVLSHPRLVEAIEDEFVPLAILNNKGGHDREVLRRFGEPAWNNPVVRFVDAKGEDLIPRRDRVWTDERVLDRMIESLEASGRAVPGYLAALQAELAPARIERATFGMACYWSGEACLGGVEGLLSSRTAHLDGHEVVELRYDPTRISYAELLRQARRKGCADTVFVRDESRLAIAQTVFGPGARRTRGVARDASSRDQLFHLKRDRRLSSLEATPAQRLRLNHAAWKETDPRPHLSPRQRAEIE